MTESKSSISGLLPDAPESRNWTSPFYAIYGGYSWLNKVPIHYFQTVFTVKDLHDYVSLMSQLNDVEKWGFEALFQRQLKSERVDAIVDKYLRNEAKTKFFPPITLALMPQSARGELKTSYDETNLVLDSVTTENRPEIARLSLQGLEIDYEPSYKDPNSNFPKIASVCRLKWDSSAFVALAIDGQHRVEALRRYTSTPGSSVSYDVPVILVFIDPAWSTESDLVKVTREIFIDINKNARPVDDSRLILLDDRNFSNAVTRALVAPSFNESLAAVTHKYEAAYERVDGKPSSLELIPLGVPQELVDITMGRESADINKLKPWNFTSAYILNRAITNNLLSAKDVWAEFELLLESHNFSSGAGKPYEIAVAKKREYYSLSEEENTESQSISDPEMLSFTANDTYALVKIFLDRYGVLLRATYTSFTPYKEFIQQFLQVCQLPLGLNIRLVMIAEGSIEGSGAVTWNSSVSKKFQRSNATEFEACKNQILKLQRPAGWSDSIVWYSLFQLSLLYKLRILQNRLATIHGIPQKIPETEAIKREDWSRELFAEIYLRELNFLYSAGVFNKNTKTPEGYYLWQGLATKAQDNSKMEGSINASGPVGEMLHHMICTRYLLTRNQSDVKPEHRKWAISKIRAGYKKVEKELFKNKTGNSPTDADSKNLDAAVDKRFLSVTNYIASL